jgi:thioredoxin 1
VIHARSEPQLKELIATAKRSVVVAFSASWCRSSRYISPVFHELSTQYPSTIFVKVDVDELQAAARSHGVTTTPTFQFFRGGAKRAELRGADSGGLEKRIQRHYVAEGEADDNTASEGSDDCEGLRQRKPKPLVVTVATDEQWQRLVQQNQESSKAVHRPGLVGGGAAPRLTVSHVMPMPVGGGVLGHVVQAERGDRAVLRGAERPVPRGCVRARGRRRARGTTAVVACLQQISAGAATPCLFGTWLHFAE